MAGSTKVAVLATLMYALLLSSCMVEAARPIVSEGSAVAADGSVMTRDPHSRQLRFFFFKCWWFWGCGRPIYHPVKDYGYHGGDRKLMSTGNGRQLKTFWYGWPYWYKSFYFWRWWH